MEHILPDGVERTLKFAEGANSATYMAYHFDPEIFREEMQVPFVIDKENGQVKLSFSGIDIILPSTGIHPGMRAFGSTCGC